MLCVVFSAFLTVMNSPDLEALRWHYRVILLFADTAVDPRLLQQRQVLAQQTAALAERDLRIFEQIGPSETNDKLRERFGVSGKEFAVILLGKDGTRKLHSASPVEPSKLFRLIDSMPMRRDEINRPPKLPSSK